MAAQMASVYRGLLPAVAGPVLASGGVSLGAAAA
jgi:hypothetical protein